MRTQRDRWDVKSEINNIQWKIINHLKNRSGFSRPIFNLLEKRTAEMQHISIYLNV